jgi:hypothetical protein
MQRNVKLFNLGKYLILQILGEQNICEGNKTDKRYLSLVERIGQ